MVKFVTVADKTVTTAGTRVQLTTTSTPAIDVVFQAHSSNTNGVYIGDASVANNQGIRLTPGEIMSINEVMSGRRGDEWDLSDFWFDADANGNKVRVAYVKRR